MKTQNKKGFTIVELVIVIAVIAILAAVLIPTFINLTKKANESADIQACRQMNTQLAINEVLKGKSITEVHAALKSGGMDTENYTPLVEGHYFFWDSELNRILYMDADNNVLYPEEYKKNTTCAKGQRLSLNGKIGMKEVTPGNDDVYSISSAEELYWLSEQSRSHKIKNNVKIKFTAPDIDLKGADIGFQFSNGSKDTASFICSIEGKEGSGTTLYGLAQITQAYTGTVNDNAGKDYACGFVQLVEGNVNLTIKNLTIANSTVGNLEIGGVGAVVGKSQANGGKPVVTLENVTVKDSVINGRNKVGGLIGNVGSTVLSITRCEVENVTVNCSEGQGGKVIGAIYGGGSKLTIDKAFSSWVTGSTVNLVKGAVERDTMQAKGSYPTIDGKETIEIVSGTLLVRKYNMKDGVLTQAAEYRMFNQNAYMSVEITNCGGNFEYKIGTESQTVNQTTHAYGNNDRYAKVDETNKCFPCWIVTK